MTWARLDDTFPAHPKVLALTDRLFRVHVTAICYAAQYSTDGHVPEPALRLLGATPKDAKQLASAGLWDAAGDGWDIHDYLDYNPSRDDVQAARDQRSRAGRASAARRTGGQRAVERPVERAVKRKPNEPLNGAFNNNPSPTHTPATDFANAQSAAAAAAPDAEALGTLRVAIGGIVDRDPTLLDECQQLASEYTTEQLVAAIAECRRTRGTDNRFLRPYPGNLRRFLPDLAPSTPQRPNDPSANLPDAADLFANVLAKKRAKDAAAAAARAAEEARS